MKKYITTFSLAKITVCFLVLFANFANAQTVLPGQPSDIVVPVSLGELKPFWRSQPVLGPYLQDGLNAIEIPNYMLQTDFPYQKRSFATEVPFADNLSVVRLLGGYSKYPGISGTLTDLTTPGGIALLNQLRAYDFVYRKIDGTLAFRPELIQQRLLPYLALGYEDLTIVLDNIPWDLTTNTANASLNSSYGNIGVPNVSQEWYDTVKELCTTLISIMGTEKANKVRFRIGTEMNSLERFNGTEAQFITHYDNAAAAIESVLPTATLSLFNISGATVANINSTAAHNVGAFRVLDHIANENNQKTGVKLTNIPNFVSFSKYFYEGSDLSTIVSTSDEVWDHVNTNISGYQNKFSREIHEFGGLADWDATPITENEGAFGGAMTLQVFMKYMEVGVDRIYHWNSFKSIPNGAVRYQIPSSQAWAYSVLDYLSGGVVYKILPDAPAPTTTRAATVTSMLSVKSGKSYLLVNSFDTDKTNTEVSEVVIRIPKSYLPSISLASTKMASLTNANCVLNEIRRDVVLAGNLNPSLVSKPDYIPSDFQDLCVDYEAFKAMVLSNATKYESLWKQSLTLTSLGGNITEEGNNFVIKLNMIASQNSVIVLQGPLVTTGTLTANPKTVTAFTVTSAAGVTPITYSNSTTALTMSSSNAAKVVITHESAGSTISAEAIVIDNEQRSFSDLTFDNIKEGTINTFRLYATEAGSSIFGGTPLATVIVTGELQKAPIQGDVATNGDYRSLTSGYWSTPGTWQVRASGSWATATVAPTAANTVYIQAGHTIILTGESNCYSLHIEKTGKLAAGSSTLNVYGKLRCYVLAVAATGAIDNNTATTPASYLGVDIAATAMVDGMLTSTAGYTTLKFKGLARTLVNGNEWSTSATAPAISAEFALNAGLAGTFSNGVRFSNLTLSSGSYFIGNIANVIMGDFIIKNGAKFQTQATGTDAGSIGNIAGTPAGKLEIEEGGTLTFRTAAPTINFNTFVNNGTVIYVLSAPMSFMTNANGSSTPDVNTYNNITISNILNNITGTTLTATSAISIKGILNVVDNNTLNTNGTGGSVTLKSTATKTATIGTIGTGIINDNVIVERYIPAGKRAYRLLSPATTGGTIKANWQESQAAGANSIAGYGTHITGAGGAIKGFDTTTSNASSLFTYNSATPAWTAVANTNENTLTAGSPYLIYIRGSRLATNIDASLGNDATTLRTTGALTTGTVTVSGLNATAGGFSLVGNPYQAQVDMSLVFANAGSTNLNTGFYYVVDPSMGTKGAYLTVDVTADATAHISKYLQPWQGCFVKTLSAGSTSISFMESNKSESVTQTTIFKTKNEAIAKLNLTLSDANLNRLDVLAVVFEASETNDVNQNDASKMSNFDESMATSNNGKLLSIEKRAIPTDTDEIPLNITKYRGTSYSIKAEGLGLTGSTPYLLDQYANKTTEIPQDGSVSYAYSVDAAIPASIAADRFKLIYGKTLKTIDNSVTGFALYPNPSKSNSFSVVVPQTMSKAMLTVSNLLGQKLYSQNDLQPGTTVKVNVSNVKTSGIYLVNLTSEGKTSTTKWIVQ